MEDEPGRRLTMVAQMNRIRIDFLRPQIAHVLKAKMTGKGRVSGGCSWLNLRTLRSDERIVRTRRPGVRSQGVMFHGFLKLTALHVTHHNRGLGF